MFTRIISNCAAVSAQQVTGVVAFRPEKVAGVTKKPKAELLLADMRF